MPVMTNAGAPDWYASDMAALHRLFAAGLEAVTTDDVKTVTGRDARRPRGVRPRGIRGADTEHQPRSTRMHPPVTQPDTPPSATLRMTPFCRRLGLTAPVVQAPVGSASTPELAAAVSNAGGLGMLALTWTPPGAVRERIRATRALTDRPFGVNLVLEWDQHERLRACAEEPVAVVSTFWGDPRPYVDPIHAPGALHLHTVGSAEEARRAVEAGVDVIVAQGWEAGGRVCGAGSQPAPRAGRRRRGPAGSRHRGGRSGRWTRTRRRPRPRSRRRMGGHALPARARGERPPRVAASHPRCFRDQHLVRDASSIATGPMRRIARCATARWTRGRGPDDPPLPRRPGEGDVVAHAPDGTCLYRYGASAPVSGTTGNVEALALYAGQSAGIVKDVRPAAAIVPTSWSRGPRKR